VELSPRVTYAEGGAPDAVKEAELHHRAHEGCFIANSVRTEIQVRSVKVERDTEP
jgi:organic hydroperoxide reductase OsmC/OhrA